MNKQSKLARDGAVWGLIMVAPTIIGLLVLNIWPFIETIYRYFFAILPPIHSRSKVLKLHWLGFGEVFISFGHINTIEPGFCCRTGFVKE